MRLSGLGLVTVALVCLAAANVGSATVWRIELDPDQSEVYFELDATLHRVTGQMALERGSISFDTETGRAMGEVVVAAGSAETGHKKRDREMHRKVLLSERFPEIVFLPDTVEGPSIEDTEVDLLLTGVVEIQATRHPVVWAVRASRHHDWIRAEGELRVPYVAWGLKDPSKLLLRVGKTVLVRVRVEGRMSEVDEGD